MSEVTSIQPLDKLQFSPVPSVLVFFPLTTFTAQSVMVLSWRKTSVEVSQLYWDSFVTLHAKWVTNRQTIPLQSASCRKILWKHFLLLERWCLKERETPDVFNYKCECGFRSRKHHANVLYFSFHVNSISVSTTSEVPRHRPLGFTAKHTDVFST